ncbi:MAG: arginine--tRNA ligase [Ectothiorhodospiraceae bacterium]|nr:arginine--tRNA ligase [Ectothiorhodospiraceae bacterium]
MKTKLQALLDAAVETLRRDGVLPPDLVVDTQLTRTRDKTHGDFASNVAMQLAKPARRSPRDIAQAIVERIGTDDVVAKCEIAGPGFINFFLSADARLAVVPLVLKTGSDYGRSHFGRGRRVQVEFVSANPTGPLHVGHGRGAAYGAAVADLLEAVGFDVHREYYVNDAGRQMDILAASVWLRYLERCGVSFPFPTNAYKGEYVRDIAQQLFDEHGNDYAVTAGELLEGLPPDEPDGGDKEIYIDAMIGRARHLLGDNRYRYVFELGLNDILDDIRQDLEEFGVSYDTWYSERSLADRGAVNLAIERLRDAGALYEQEGALWFRSTDFGDEKDRVVQRENGQTTYFASDIAYHLDKLERGYDRVIDVWGADHHGYVPRVKAALKALGEDEARLDVLLVQFAILYRGGERVQMSTRSGSFVTLRELRDEVGNDAARFFYVLRRCEQHMDFDLDLAKSQSSDNPVYYVQYAHARICSVMRQLADKGMTHDLAVGEANLFRLVEEHEQALFASLARYPEIVEGAALTQEPHQIAHFLRDLACELHTYYNAHQFLVEAPELRNARLSLILAVRQVIANGLALLGVSAPEEM